MVVPYILIYLLPIVSMALLFRLARNAYDTRFKNDHWEI